MLVAKPKHKLKSHAICAIVQMMVVEKMFEEPGFNNFSDDDDPYVESTPENVMKYLNELDSFEVEQKLL